MTNVFSHIGAWAPKAEQLAVASYLNTEDMASFLDEKIHQYNEISQAICYFLLKMKNLHYKVDYKTPDGGIYISLYLGYNDKFESLEAFIDFLIENGIGIVPFEYFGSKSNKGWFRISIGTLAQDQLEGLFLTLEETIKKLHDK
jgi:aspartate aminotransferase